MDDKTRRRGKLPESEIDQIFKSVSYAKNSKKKHNPYFEDTASKSQGAGDEILKDFYRMDEGKWGILQGVSKVVK